MWLDFSMVVNHRLTRLVIILLLGGGIVGFGGCKARHYPLSFENVPAIITQVPCVAGICVGDTGRQEVGERLSQYDLVDNIREDGGPVWFNIEGGGSGGIYFRQDQLGSVQSVERIRLVINGMPLGKVLNTIGEPTELFLMFGCGRGSYIHGKLFYPEQGIEVQAQFPVNEVERTEQIALTDETPVAWIWYFDPEQYNEWLLGIHEDLIFDSSFDFASGVTNETLVASVQPWPGMNTPVQPLDLCPR